MNHADFGAFQFFWFEPQRWNKMPSIVSLKPNRHRQMFVFLNSWSSWSLKSVLCIFWKRADRRNHFLQGFGSSQVVHRQTSRATKLVARVRSLIQEAQWGFNELCLWHFLGPTSWQLLSHIVTYCHMLSHVYASISFYFYMPSLDIAVFFLQPFCDDLDVGWLMWGHPTRGCLKGAISLALLHLHHCNSFIHSTVHRYCIFICIIIYSIHVYLGRTTCRGCLAWPSCLVK